MYEDKTIIDSDGYIVEKHVICKDGVLENHVLGEGEQIVPYITKSQVINGRPVEYLKPQWNGQDWIETATQEELNIAYPAIVREPSIEEKNRSDIDYIIIMQGL